jgi:hypothetical protein
MRLDRFDYVGKLGVAYNLIKLVEVLPAGTLEGFANDTVCTINFEGDNVVMRRIMGEDKLKVNFPDGAIDFDFDDKSSSFNYQGTLYRIEK